MISLMKIYAVEIMSVTMGLWLLWVTIIYSRYIYSLRTKNTKQSLDSKAEDALQEARNLLGYWHKIYGEIIHGDHRGRELGYPTANIELNGTTKKIYKEINFPIIKYPDKINSLNLKKNKLYSGVLTGIKGQYLIFEDSTVFNIRSNEGLKVEIDIG
mgnify:CR=1 FL=1